MVKLPPTNNVGTFERPLTKDEWRAIKSEAETRLRGSDTVWAALGALAQIKECEKHL
jgi:hypothetical protein